MCPRLTDFAQIALYQDSVTSLALFFVSVASLCNNKAFYETFLSHFFYTSQRAD